MSTVEDLAEIWPRILTILSLCLDITVSGHAILYKRDSRAAVAWVGFIWFVPVVGALLYLLLGINRIQRRAPCCAGAVGEQWVQPLKSISASEYPWKTWRKRPVHRYRR